MAAMKAHRKRSRPWPSGCTTSAGTPPRRTEIPSKTSFNESAREWPASASKAADPDSRPATSFAAATSRLTASAVRIVRVVSLWAALRRAALERRGGNAGSTLGFRTTDGRPPGSTVPGAEPLAAE